jgi:hypothetical protein
MLSQLCFGTLPSLPRLGIEIENFRCGDKVKSRAGARCDRIASQVLIGHPLSSAGLQMSKSQQHERFGIPSQSLRVCDQLARLLFAQFLFEPVLNKKDAMHMPGSN